MGQERYHNYGRPLQSLPENYRLLGLLAQGVYAGFDTFEIVAGTTLKLKHTLSGTLRLKLDGTGNDGPFGAFVTKQGVVIYDDTEVQVAVDLAVVNPRVDVLVVNHTFLDSPGGSPASYSIIKGAEAAFPVEPGLALPLSQVKIGTFIVYPGADHSATVFVRAEVKKLGGTFPFGTKTTESDLGTSPEQDFNKVERSGIYFMDNVTTNRPTTVTAYWTLIVFKRGDRLSQLALETQSGRAYVRAAITFTGGRVSTWGSWINLNNPDVPAVDLSAILASIGSQTYTQNNYVTDGQSLTLSVDALDIALKVLDVLLDQAIIDIDNLETMIGNRTYTDTSFLTSGESLTASLNKLTKAGLSNHYAFATDLNSILVPGTQIIYSTDLNAPVDGTDSGTYLYSLTTTKYRNSTNTDNNLVQVATKLTGSGGASSRRNNIVFRRIKAGAAAWGAWGMIGSGLSIRTGSLNLDTQDTWNTLHLIPNGLTRIITAHCLISPVAPALQRYDLNAGGYCYWSDTSVFMVRTTGGIFDSPTFNSANYEVHIEYNHNL